MASHRSDGFTLLRWFYFVFMASHFLNGFTIFRLLKHVDMDYCSDVIILFRRIMDGFILCRWLHHLVQMTSTCSDDFTVLRPCSHILDISTRLYLINEAAYSRLISLCCDPPLTLWGPNKTCTTVGKLWPISAQETQALYSIIIRFACQPCFMWEVFWSMNTDLSELVISNTTDRVTSSLKN